MSRTPIAAGTVAIVRDSFARATGANGQFFEQFYDRLLSQKPVYRAMFGDVNMVHQYARLHGGIQKLLEYAENPVPETLTMIASIHKSPTLTVQGTHYLDWVDSLLSVLSDSDEQFDAEIADHWVTVVMPGIEFMKAYGQG